MVKNKSNRYLNFTWFNLEKDQDLDIVFDFLKNLPENFNQLFDERYSNLKEFLINNESKEFLDLYLKSLEESFAILSKAIKVIEYRIYRGEVKKRRYYRRFYFNKLKNIGFTGSSLSLKANLLNSLGLNIKEHFKELGIEFLELTNDNLLRALIKFFRILNIITKSLKIVIGQLEAFIELKEILEKYFDLTDRLTDLHKEES